MEQACTTDPRPWDLDQGDLDDWLGAIELCERCPWLGECQKALDEQLERPRAVIWAGIAFGERAPLNERGLRQRAVGRRRSMLRRGSGDGPEAA